MRVIRTVGHGTLAAEAFAAVVRTAEIDLLVDVRRFPASRRHPQFGGEAMATWLPDHGVEYRWLPALGGRRPPVPGSPNVRLRNEQFRGYADHMASREFRAGAAELVRVATTAAAAIMCAESVWWRCHRRLLADHLLLVAHVPVEHVFHDGRLVRHVPTPVARQQGETVVYDVGVQQSLLGEEGEE